MTLMFNLCRSLIYFEGIFRTPEPPDFKSHYILQSLRPSASGCPCYQGALEMVLRALSCFLSDVLCVQRAVNAG